CRDRRYSLNDMSSRFGMRYSLLHLLRSSAMTVPHLHRPVHAFTNDVLASHDGTALAQLIRTGELSVAEVTEAAINRARQVEPAVHGLAAEAFGPALAAAKKAISSGAFAGVPTLIKDNTD